MHENNLNYVSTYTYFYHRDAQIFLRNNLIIDNEGLYNFEKGNISENVMLHYYLKYLAILRYDLFRGGLLIIDILNEEFVEY